MRYRGEPEYIDLPEDYIFGNPNQQRSKAIVRSRYETCNRHFKEWKCLSMMFWHALDKHGRIFCAGIVLTQIKIDYESKLFVVDYKTIVCNLTLIQKILVESLISILILKVYIIHITSILLIDNKYL